MKTIKDVAKEMNISEHTLRFWSKEGLFPTLGRDKNNVRTFTEDDLQWVLLVKCFRSAGMQLTEVKKYIALCQIGDSTVQERYEIIKTAKQRTLEKFEDLNNQLAKLNCKEAHYEEIIKKNLKDSYNPINKMGMKVEANVPVK